MRNAPTFVVRAPSLAVALGLAAACSTRSNEPELVRSAEAAPSRAERVTGWGTLESNENCHPERFELFACGEALDVVAPAADLDHALGLDVHGTPVLTWLAQPVPCDETVCSQRRAASALGSDGRFQASVLLDRGVLVDRVSVAEKPVNFAWSVSAPARSGCYVHPVPSADLGIAESPWSMSSRRLDACGDAVFTDDTDAGMISYRFERDAWSAVDIVVPSRPSMHELHRAPNGVSLFAWHDVEGTFAITSSPTVPWSEAVPLRHWGGYLRRPYCTLGPTGIALCAWYERMDENVATEWSLVARFFDPSQGWLEASVLGDLPWGEQNTRIAIGRVDERAAADLVIYTHASGNEQHYTAQHDPESGWSELSLVDAQLPPAALDFGRHVVEIESDAEGSVAYVRGATEPSAARRVLQEHPDGEMGGLVALSGPDGDTLVAWLTFQGVALQTLEMNCAPPETLDPGQVDEACTRTTVHAPRELWAAHIRPDGEATLTRVATSAPATMP